MPSQTIYQENSMPQWMSELFQANALEAKRLREQQMNTPHYKETEIADLPEEFHQAKKIASNIRGNAPYIQESQEFLRQGAKNFPSSSNEYMNPYIQQVIDKMRDVTNRNYFENIRPNIESQFISAGIHGGQRNQMIRERSERDLSETIAREAARLLSQGYKDSANQFSVDKAREMEASKQLGELGELERIQKQSDISNLDNFSTQQQNQTQMALDLQKQKYLREKTAPWETLSRENAILQGLPAQNIMTQHYQTPAPMRTNAAGNIGAMGMQMAGANMAAGRGGIFGLKRGGAVRQASRMLRNLGI